MLKWQKALVDVISDPLELLRALNIDARAFEYTSVDDFPLRVPRDFVARMAQGDVNDPLLRQVLPLNQENIVTSGFCKDPLQELRANPAPGLLHKFHGRVLLTLVGDCAIHCRYCFRRYFPYAHNPNQQGWQDALSYIAKDASITEVIYSGGDPLMAKDAYLQEMTQKIAAISHIKRVRIHTRLPIVIPERVTDALLVWLTQTRLKTIVVLHCNHANEVDSKVGSAIAKLIAANIPVLNQAVLLRGVNDSVAALVNLSESLFEIGILPYYLHLLDPVQGAAHFQVPEAEAKRLVWQAAQQLPGYLVPKLVREQPGQPAKVPILSSDS